jgi:hypothetical protein
LEAALLTNSHIERGAAYDALRKKLPSGVPHELITRFWAEQMRFPVAYAKLYRTPDEYMDAVLAGLRAWDSPAATFLVRAAADGPMPDALRAANRAFAVLANSPSPYTPKGRATILAALAHPPVLAGAQAAVAAHGWRDDAYSFARALVYDGGDASVEVLRRWVRAGIEARDLDLKELGKLARFAQTPSMNDLLSKELLAGLP